MSQKLWIKKEIEKFSWWKCQTERNPSAKFQLQRVKSFFFWQKWKLFASFERGLFIFRWIYDFFFLWVFSTMGQTDLQKSIKRKCLPIYLVFSFFLLPPAKCLIKCFTDENNSHCKFWCFLSCGFFGSLFELKWFILTMENKDDEVKKSQVVEARARNISHNVRCTECGSQSIEDSQADIAILLRKV